MAGTSPVAEPSTAVPARDVVLAYLSRQVAELHTREPQVRRDEPDAVHKMRVAVRRLRSALATYRPLLHRREADRLREELRWLGECLGRPRDAEVMTERVSGLLAGDAQHDGVVEHLHADHREAHEALLVALDGRRYRTLLADLDACVADPPWRRKADAPATQVLPRIVRREWQRLERRVPDPSHGTDTDLHEARKAAKRVRYAVEVVVPVYDGPAERLAEELSEVQTVLGEHQDSVVARELIDSFAPDREHPAWQRHRTTEAERARLARERFAEVWQRTARPTLRAWLD